MTPEQFGRLPGYAQKELTALRASVDSLQRTIKTIRNEEQTKIRWGYENLSESFGYIRDIETVFFFVDGPRRAIRARLREGGSVLNLNADDGMIIEPYSTNDITVRLKR
jgi:hypothetical protein